MYDNHTMNNVVLVNNNINISRLLLITSPVVVGKVWFHVPLSIDIEVLDMVSVSIDKSIDNILKTYIVGRPLRLAKVRV